MSEFPVDPGNPFANQSYPSNISCGVIPTSDGQMLLVTFRSGPATLTILLSKQDAASWGKLLIDTSAQMSSLIVAGPVIPPNLANGQMN